MKVLFVCRFKSSYTGHVAPFIADQAEALKAIGVQVAIFKITAYNWQNYRLLLKNIQIFQPDLIHAHYGITGFFTNLQRKVPVVTTFHGSDINDSSVRRLSKLACKLSVCSVFVTPELLYKSGCKQNTIVVPCGVDTRIFKPIPRQEARHQLGLPADRYLVLFGGSFDNPVKNARLAFEVANQFDDLRLLELKGYSRHEVALLMNAVDLCLLTSHSEGSPQFVKEAMACNCPVVAMPVGDVEKLLTGVSNSFVVNYDPELIREKIEWILKLQQRSDGSKKINELGVNNQLIAERLKNLYLKISQ